MFGDPFVNPTFEEFAMYVAYASSLRSSDLSRQVGAVVTRGNDIVALGANDSPSFGGGQYWTRLEEGRYISPSGTDAARGYDANKIEYKKLVDEVLDAVDIHPNHKKRKDYESALKKTSLSSLTEYGRGVHAEMEALSCCARNGVSTKGCSMFVTTFPCHNCAKHIVAMGIKNVYYIEPYPKSKALSLHNDTVSTDVTSDDMVHFIPFTGVGPRRFMELFAMNSPPLYEKKRKDKNGMTLTWMPEDGKLRTPLLPKTYLDLEIEHLNQYNLRVENINKARETKEEPS